MANSAGFALATNMNSPLVRPRERVKALFLGTAILLVPLSDVNVGFGETFLRSISVLPMLGLTLMLLPERLSQRIQMRYVIWFGGVSIVTLYQIIYFGGQFLDSNLVYKSITNLIFMSVFFIPAILYQADIRHYRWPILVGLCICVSGFIAGDVVAVSLFSDYGPLHTVPNIQSRARGLAPEASIFSPQLFLLSCMAIQAWRSWLLKTLLFVFCSIVIVFSFESKGSVIIMIPSFAVAIFLLHRRYFLVWLWLSLFLLVLSQLWVPFFRALWSDIVNAEGSSLSTRLTLAIAFFKMVISHPFGVGLGSMAPELHQSLQSAMTTTQDLTNFKFRSAELFELLLRTETDRYLNTKIGFGDFVLLTGWFGILFLINLFLRSVCSVVYEGHFFLLVGVLFAFFALLTYLPFYGNYSVTILLIFAQFTNNKRL